MTESKEIIKRAEDLGIAIVQAAEDQVTKAQANLDRAKSIADIILSQARDAARQVDELTATHHAGTERILEGYRIIEGEPKKPTPDYYERAHESDADYYERTVAKLPKRHDELSKLAASVPSLVDGRQ